jgi:hypothetical protein
MIIDSVDHKTINHDDDKPTTAPDDILTRLNIDTSDLPPLKPRQLRFLNYLFAGESTPNAYKLAGYKKKRADTASYRLMTHPPVSIYVQLCRDKMKPIATYADRISALWDIASNCSNSDARIKAIAEINKMQGDYQPVQNINISVNTTATLEDIRHARLEYKQYTYVLDTMNSHYYS